MSDALDRLVEQEPVEIRTSYSTLASPPYRWMCWIANDDEGPLAFAEHEHLAIAKLKRMLEERMEEPF